MLSRFSSALLLLLVACHLGAQENLKVVATASMISDMVQNIAGDQVDLQCIVPIGGDPHLYEPTPGDAKMVVGADLIFINGLTFEGWLNELIENSGSRAKVVTVTDGIEPIASTTYTNAVDPHAWMDARWGKVYAANILAGLVDIDPAGGDQYRDRYAHYVREIEETDTYIFQQISLIPPDRRVLITSHDAFQYYGRRYGLQLESVLGTSTDADIQTSDLLRLNRVIKERKVPAVFIESTINPKMLEQLASDNQIVVGGSLFADSIGDEDSEAPTYLAMLRYNTDVIVEALTQRSGATNPGSSTAVARGTWLYYLIGVVILIIAAVAYFRFAS